MKTHCPDCSTRFDVTPAQLNARNGKVRCGVCATVFNAFDHVVAEEPDFPVLQAGSSDAEDSLDAARAQRRYPQPVRTAGSGTGPASRHDDERHDALLDQAIEPTFDDSEALSPTTPNPNMSRSERERFVVDAPSLSGSGAYSRPGRGDGPQLSVQGQYRRRVQRDTEYDDPERSNGSGLIWFLAVLLALIVLFAQGAIVFRNQIVNVAPTLRPQLVQLCSFVGCQVGYTRSVRHLAILNPALRQVNNTAAQPETRAFSLHAIIKNNDTIAQPLPSLVLSLKDASESVSARRIIKPQEYLLPEAQKRAFQPNDEIAINLPVLVSRTDVAGFELSLFYP